MPFLVYKNIDNASQPSIASSFTLSHLNMEAVGDVAPLLTLIAVAKHTHRLLRGFYETVDEASCQILNTSGKVFLVKCLLEQILALRPGLEDGDEQLVPLDLKTALVSSLQVFPGIPPSLGGRLSLAACDGLPLGRPRLRKHYGNSKARRVD